MLTTFPATTTAADLEQSMIMSLAREYEATGKPVELNRVQVWLGMDKRFDVSTIRKIAKYVAGHALHMRKDGPGDWQGLGSAVGSAALNGFPQDDEGSGP